MLKVHGVDYIAVDADVDIVTQGARRRRPNLFWRCDQPDLVDRIAACQSARALVVTMDSTAGAEEVVAVARAARDDLLIVSRARDARHAGRLYMKGATDAVPETVEASLLLSETLLVDIGVPMGPVITSIHERRAQFRAEIQKLAPGSNVRSARRRLLRDRGRGPEPERPTNT